MGEEGEGVSLEFTPTWVLAAFCAVVVAIALAMERFLHFVGNVLKKKQQKPLFEALLKVKEGNAFFFLYFFFHFLMLNLVGSVKGKPFFPHILHLQKENLFSLSIYLQFPKEKS